MEDHYRIDETKVLESRMSSDGQSIRRRRMAADGTRFTTYERIEKPELIVLKKHGGQEFFSRDKLRIALNRAVGKFVTEMEIEEIINRVEDLLLIKGNKVESKRIGDAVLQVLFDINKVAYVRFASVFYEFSTIDDFEKILAESKKGEKR